MEDAIAWVRIVLGARLLAQIGTPRHTMGDTLAHALIAFRRLLPRKQKPVLQHLPDGMLLVSNCWKIRGTSGYTLGNYLFLRSIPPERLLLVHEYIHVLQWRAEGAHFLGHYIRAGLWNWPPYDARGWPADTEEHNPYETQALQIEAIYRRTPGLPEPWLLGSCETNVAAQSAKQPDI